MRSLRRPETQAGGLPWLLQIGLPSLSNQPPSRRPRPPPPAPPYLLGPHLQRSTCAQSMTLFSSASETRGGGRSVYLHVIFSCQIYQFEPCVVRRPSISMLQQRSDCCLLHAQSMSALLEGGRQLPNLRYKPWKILRISSRGCSCSMLRSLIVAGHVRSPD